MKTFFLFLKGHVRAIVTAGICMAVFALLMVIYGVPTVAVFYAELISFIVFAFAAVWDLAEFARKHRILEALKHEILLTDEHLPETSDVIELGYEELIHILCEEKYRLSEEAEKRAEDSSVYFTLWTHQIKTPISAMYLALKEAGEDEIYPHEFTEELTDELRKIERYAEMTLCYVRLEDNSDDFVFGSVSADKIVKSAVKRFSQQFIRRKIRLLYSPTKIEVLTDEKWLLFAVEQLISNALKYTREGAVEIVTEDIGNFVELTVRDTGTGIPAEDLPRIFEHGFTGLNGRAENRSTGIGLYLTKRICSRLGHTISAKNRSDGITGAEFTIRFEKELPDTRE